MRCRGKPISALREIGYSVTIIERGSYDQRRVGETLPPEVRIPLASLGLWDDFCALEFGQAPGRLSAWGSDRLDAAEYVFNAYGNRWLVTRPRFEQMLSAAAADRGATHLCGARLRSHCRTDDG